MKYPYFSTVDKETLKEITRKGGLKNRSKDAQIAWDKAEEIKGSHPTYSHRQLAKIYKVSHATIQRIINS